jgi:hypothetical protein
MEFQMTKEHLQERLKEIEQAINQLVANLNMLEGRKQEIIFTLEKMDKPAVIDEPVDPA